MLKIFKLTLFTNNLSGKLNLGAKRKKQSPELMALQEKFQLAQTYTLIFNYFFR